MATTAVVRVVITGGPESVTYPENDTDAVGTYTASDSDAAWSVSGDDMDDFAISDGGELTFVASPNYEDPADTDGDNVYNVTVVATVDEMTATRDVTVTVTNLDEGPVVRYDGDGDGDDRPYDELFRRDRWLLRRR